MNRLFSSKTLRNLSLPLGSTIFLIWLLMFIDGIPLADDLAHLDNYNDVNLFIWYFIVILLIFSPLMIFFKSKARLILCISCFASWIVFFISWVVYLRGGSVDPFNAPEINMGLFIIHNYWIMVTVGTTSMLFLVSIMKHKLDVIARERESAGIEMIISTVIWIVISFSHQYLMAFDLEHVIALGCFPALLWQAWSTRKAEPVTGHKNVFYGILLFLTFFALLFFATWIGTTTLFYFSIEFGILILSCGFLATVISLEIIARATRNKVPWYLPLFGAFITGIFQFYQFFTVNNSSDSTYDTNPANLASLFLTGMLIGFLLMAVNLAYLQFKMQDRSNRRIAHEMGRWLLCCIIVGSIFYGILEGLGEKTNGDDMHEQVYYAIFALVLILGILAGLVGIGVKLEKYPMVLAKVERVTITHDMPSSRVKKGFTVLFMISVVSGTCFSVIPNLVPVPTNTLGYPNFLGTVGGCIVTEVSPLSKVGKYDLIPNPYTSTGSMINRSMARNEFETIQVVLSNWGLSDLLVTNVTISNSTFGNLDTAFSRPPVNKSWKNSTWELPRFTALHVDEIQPGNPNVLYELNGNQTKVQFISGTNETRPPPVARAGSNLALWFTLYASNDTARGTYSDDITIQTSAGNFKVTLVTTIWNFTLPTSHSLRVAMGNRNLDQIENRDDWIKSFLTHRMSPYFPFDRNDYYTVNRADSNVTFNFTQFEIDLANAIHHGLDSFRITFKPGDVYGENAFNQYFNDTAMSFYSQLGAFLDGHNLTGNRTWLDLSIVYAIDEPNEEEYEGFNKWSDLVHASYPGWKILLTEQVETPIKDHVDIWCPHINHVETANIPLRHAEGNDFWYYTCCSLVNKPTVSFVDPATDHLALFWCAWAFDFDGFLFWDVQAYVNTTGRNISTLDPFKLGYDGIGDAIMLLSDANIKPVTTIVWETMRDGLENLEYLEMLHDMNPTSSIIADVRARWSDFINYPRDYVMYLQLRNEIGEYLDANT